MYFADNAIQIFMYLLYFYAYKYFSTSVLPEFYSVSTHSFLYAASVTHTDTDPAFTENTPYPFSSEDKML